MSPSRRLTNMSSSVMSSPIASIAAPAGARLRSHASADALVRRAVPHLERLDAGQPLERRLRLEPLVDDHLGGRGDRRRAAVGDAPPVQAHRARLALDERAGVARGQRARASARSRRAAASAAARRPSAPSANRHTPCSAANATCGNRAARSSTRSRGRPVMIPSVTPGRGRAHRAAPRVAIDPASCGVGANGTNVPSRSTAHTSDVAAPSCCQSAGMRKP